MDAKAALPAWYPQQLFPFESRFVEAKGARLHYIESGSGPTLLLLHGNPAWSFLYRHLIAELSPAYRCIAPDFPGFGLSTAPPSYDFRPVSHAEVLREFCNALRLRDMVMMVQDWSGPIGLSVAAEEPDRFSGLVVGNTWAWSGKGDPHFERFSRFMGGSFAGFLNQRFNFFPRFVLRMGMSRRRLTREEWAAYLAPFAAPHSRAPLRTFPREIIGSTEFLAALEARLPRLAHLPALIVWGDRDFAFREIERRRFEAIFPNHVTVLLPGAGHFIQEDAPAEIARAIRARWGR